MLVMESKRFFSIFFLCILLFASCQRVEKNYYPNGVLEAEVKYKKAKMDGVSIWYYQSGRKSMEITYNEGLKEGKMLRFYRSGKRQSVENYIHDSLDGISLNYDEDGILVSETSYKEGKKNGETKQYHPDGSLLLTGKFTNDLYDEKWTYFDMDGFKVGEGSFDQGNGILTGYDENGNITRKVYYEKNSIVKEEIYLPGGQEIEKIRIHENGRVVDVQSNENSTKHIQ